MDQAVSLEPLISSVAKIKHTLGACIVINQIVRQEMNLKKRE